MPNISIGGGASTSIGLGMGAGVTSSTYMPSFNPGPVPSFIPQTTAGKLYQGQLAVQNSRNQFNQFLQNQGQQLYGDVPQTNNQPGSVINTQQNGFAAGKFNGLMGGAGNVMSMANKAIFANSASNRSSEDQAAAEVRDNISDAMVKSGNPYVMAAGLAAKLADGVMDATGVRSNQITKKQQEKAGISPVARIANNFANYFPGNPLAAGGKKISDSEMSLDTEQVRGAFAGTLDDIDTAQTMGGARVNFMLGGARNKMENYVQEQNRKNALLTNISRTNTLRKQNDYAQELNKQNENRYNGNTYQSMAVGKEGLKLPDREVLDALYAKKVTFFKEGGVIGVDSNVIPEGALHKELNHMEKHNEELDKVITDKGIAVVSTDKEGNIEQVAEIEKEEIVFRLELTKKIEELWHEGTPEAMLKAGKILVKEIMGNTDDNTEEILDGDN